MDILNELISYGEKRVKIVGTSNEPWFCGKDVCEILGYKSAKVALHTHIKHTYKKNLSEVVSESLTTSYNEGKAIYISEPGLYSLINKCSLPIAEKFQDWIFEEVLPSIRKKGEYKLQKALEESVSALAIKDKEIEELKFKTLQMKNFVTNVKIRTNTDYIYIVSTTQYASNNNFKPGHTDNLKKRLATYNTGQATGDQWYYCYTKKVFEAQKLDKLIHDLLSDFKDTKQKENIILHFNYLVKIIDFVVDNFNQSFEYLNNFIKTDLEKSYSLRPVIPEPIIIKDEYVSATKSDGGITLLSTMDETEVRKLLMAIVDNSQASVLTRKRIFDILEEKYVVKGFKHKVWDLLKAISYEKKLEIKYLGFAYFNGLSIKVLNLLYL